MAPEARAYLKSHCDSYCVCNLTGFSISELWELENISWGYALLKVRLLNGLDLIVQLCTLADSGFFFDFWSHGAVKFTVFGVFEELKFKISEG